MLAGYLTAAAALALLAALPGPDVAVIARFALTRGEGCARQAAFGVGIGLVAWGALTVAGLAAVLAASADLYAALKLLGAAYLVGLGMIALWRSRRAGPPLPATTDLSRARPLPTGLLTNLLNPKIAVFYTAVLPSLVPRGGSAYVWLPLLVATHVALSLVWLSAYAALLARSRSLLRSSAVARLLERVTGVVLIALGINLAFDAG